MGGPGPRDELRHHLLNGLLVIRGLCEQGRRGIRPAPEVLTDISARCEKMETAARTFFEEAGDGRSH